MSLPNPRGNAGHLLALVAGALITLSLSPFDLWPLGILSLWLLLAALQDSTPKQALLRGWLFGVGLFGAGVSWVYFSIHDYGYAPVPLALFLTAIFVAALAFLFSATFAWCYARFFARHRAGLWLGFPALWVIFEWIRSWLLTGFPWLYLGYAHLDTSLAGWAPVLGVYGLSFITALTAALLFLCFDNRGKIPWPRLWKPGLVIALPWLISIPLQQIDWVEAQPQSIKVSLVQPNISQHIKWLPEQRAKTLELLERETLKHLDSDLVIWPENAVPLFHHQANAHLYDLIKRANSGRTAIITGIPFWQAPTPDNPSLMHNSVTAIGHGATGIYHKQKLVPFGEYVPLQGILRGLIQFFDLPMSNFRPGPANQSPLTITANQDIIRVAPYVCYEIVYPDFARKLASRSDLLLTISDDSWFGTSIGPLQHLQMARMRALENGRYLVRGTNTGVTAIIDPKGRITQQAEPFKRATITGEIKGTVGTTPFGRWGSLPILIICGLLLVISRYLGSAIRSSSDPKTIS